MTRELISLAGNTFYGRRGIFESAFLEWLERDFRLSDYELSMQHCQFSLSFRGLWIYALSAISELKTILLPDTFGTTQFLRNAPD
jgi:nicotinate phosphoribosyltransferase